MEASVGGFWAERAIEIGGAPLFSTYARYVGGDDEAPAPANGLLYASKDALHFESFEKKSLLAALWPAAAGDRAEKIVLRYRWAEIDRVTDLSGEDSLDCYAPLERLLIRLNVEPNGLAVQLEDGRRVIFDCERSVYEIIRACRFRAA